MVSKITRDSTYSLIVERVFSNWTALRLAVQHGMASTEHARNFCYYISEVLVMNQPLDDSELADELSNYMDSEFNTALEDDSEKQVAKELSRLFNYFREHSVDELRTEIEKCKLPQTQPWIALSKMPPVKQLGPDDANESDDADECDISSPTGMDVDEDGFSIVRSRRKRN